MKLKDGFITHETDGKQIMVGAGGTGFSGLVRSNRTAAFIIDCLKEETTPESIADQMEKLYDAPREVIEQDILRVLESLREIGALDE